LTGAGLAGASATADVDAEFAEVAGVMLTDAATARAAADAVT
jgi:hypothetical protein